MKGRWSRWMLATAVAAACVGGPAAATAGAATIDTVANSDAGALSLAQSMFQNSALITGAHFVAHPGDGPNAVVTGALSYFPQNGTTFGLMTTGDAQSADDPNTSDRTTGSNNGAPVRGNTDQDVVILRVDFTAPANTNCLSVGSFAFYSEEYPEYVGTEYNDAFIAELDTSDWTTSGSTISAPHNFAFDPNGDVISINSTGATSMSAANAAGTTYDGATALLQAATQVTPGTHSLYLSIFDQGDQAWDSATMIDNIVIGTVPNPGEACQPGAQAKTYNLALTPASATNPTGTNHTVTAHLTDADSGDPISGGDVKFQVTGANSASGTGATNASGDAQFTYTGANSGDDTIIACFDADDDGVFCESGEPTASATKKWESAQQSSDGRMVGNGVRQGARYASNVDCPAALANARNRPFTVAWGTSTFKLTHVNSVACINDPAFTPSPAPATMAFDTQTGEAAGTVNGSPGYTLTWRLEDHGSPSPADAARLKVTRNSDGGVLLDVPLGPLSSGQNYALPPS